MLCSLCETFAISLTQHDFKAWHRRPYTSYAIIYDYNHGSYRAIVEAARKGCSFCRCLVSRADQSLPLTATEIDDSPSLLMVRLNDRNEPDTADLHFYLQGGHFRLDFCTSGSVASSMLVTASGHPRSFAPFTAASTVSQAQKWLDTCEKTHEACRRTDAQLPRRVIDVMSPKGEGYVRLHVSRGGLGRYLTLSYCWGRCQTLSTTKANFDEHLKYISMDALPRTLRDAISYARLLRFRYLWIDALCIIQDDAEDWQREAAQMSSIFEKASLSLAILDSPACDTGFLDNQSLAENVTLGTTALTVGLRHSNREDFTQPDTSSYLDLRAWTLQERILSPAVLQFSNATMRWQCCSGTASMDEPEITKGYDQDNDIDLMLNAARAALRWQYEGAPVRLWNDLASVYMARDITFPSDRPAAILGLATRFQRCRADEYVAGLWSSELHRSLLWEFVRPRDDPAHGSLSLPSWSWLGAGTAIKFHANTVAHVPRAEIQILRSTNDERGAIESTSALFARGLIEGGYLWWYPYADESHAFLPLFRHMFGEGPWDGIQCWLDTNYTSSGEEVPAHLTNLNPVGMVYCLLVSSYSVPSRRGNRDVVYEYLVLKIVHDRNLAEDLRDSLGGDRCTLYRRIGVARKHVVERGDGWPLHRLSEEPLAHGGDWVRTIHMPAGVETVVLV